MATPSVRRLPPAKPLKEFDFRYYVELWIDGIKRETLDETTVLSVAFRDAERLSRTYGRTATVYLMRWDKKGKQWSVSNAFQGGNEVALKRNPYPG